MHSREHEEKHDHPVPHSPKEPPCTPFDPQPDESTGTPPTPTGPPDTGGD